MIFFRFQVYHGRIPIFVWRLGQIHGSWTQVFTQIYFLLKASLTIFEQIFGMGPNEENSNAENSFKHKENNQFSVGGPWERTHFSFSLYFMNTLCIFEHFFIPPIHNTLWVFLRLIDVRPITSKFQLILNNFNWISTNFN